MGYSRFAGCLAVLAQQDRDDPRLYGSADVGKISSDKASVFGALLLQEIKYRCFQTTKTEVESRDLRLGKGKTGGITLAGIFVDQWATGVGKTQQLGGFIK